jgi:hypothetical protein
MAEQFSTPVRGSSGAAVSVAATGTIETDNYQSAAGFDFDGSAYPYTINPAETIQELFVTQSAKIRAVITTTSGEVATIPLNGNTIVLDKIEIDSVVFQDPNGTAAPISGGWTGE